MAKMSKKVLGEFSGKLGDVVGKFRKGKHYVSTAPGKYKISNKPNEIDKRNRFKVNGRFAKLVRSVDILYRIWDKENIPANNAFNKISKLNFNHCLPERPSAANMITPQGFYLPVKSIEPFPDRIEAELEMFDVLENESKIILVMFVSFYDPENEEYVYFELTQLNNYESDGMKFIFKYSGRDEMLAQNYKHKTVYLAAVTEDETGKIIRFSGTVGKEL